MFRGLFHQYSAHTIIVVSLAGAKPLNGVLCGGNTHICRQEFARGIQFYPEHGHKPASKICDVRGESCSLLSRADCSRPQCPALPSHQVINLLLAYSWQLPKKFNCRSQLQDSNEHELEYHLFHEPHQRSEYSELAFVSMFG